jgi:hypothetical protein
MDPSVDEVRKPSDGREQRRREESIGEDEIPKQASART